MKTVSRIIKFAGSIGLAVGMVATTSLPTFAVTEGASSTACTHITTLASTTSATIATHVAVMNNDFANRLTKMTSQDATIDQNIETARTKAFDAFTTKMTNLESKTGLTTSQKTALTTFSTDIHTAEQTRETSVDAARAAYRTSLTEAIKTRQTALTTAVTTYQTSVAAAFTAASADCGSGTAVATLRTSVKAAKDTLKTTQSGTKTATDIKALNATKIAAIKTANTDFQTAVAGYTATLSAALEASPSTSNS